MTLPWLRLRADSGSVAPLGIGLALVSLTAILLFTSASSMFLLQRRLTTLAEFAAFSGAKYSLSASDYLGESGVGRIKGLRVALDAVSDGVTREVTLCSRWQTPLQSIVQLLEFEICGRGAARSG